MAAFAERAAAKVAAGGSAGLDALKEISKAQGYAPPSDDAGNIWIKHERVTVQPIESPYDAPDDDALTKRVGTSTRRLNVEKFVRTRLALGESVESLAEHAEKHDAETAALIREIGSGPVSRYPRENHDPKRTLAGNREAPQIHEQDFQNPR